MLFCCVKGLSRLSHPMDAIYIIYPRKQKFMLPVKIKVSQRFIYVLLLILLTLVTSCNKAPESPDVEIVVTSFSITRVVTRIVTPFPTPDHDLNDDGTLKITDQKVIMEIAFEPQYSTDEDHPKSLAFYEDGLVVVDGEEVRFIGNGRIGGIRSFAEFSNDDVPEDVSEDYLIATLSIYDLEQNIYDVVPIYDLPDINAHEIATIRLDVSLITDDLK
ncbi:MAG: hypothetical protein GY943_20860 [Chloroflexi bacterium]|nr:hypothetical protein [Chloroflexota bacterium]